MRDWPSLEKQELIDRLGMKLGAIKKWDRLMKKIQNYIESDMLVVNEVNEVVL